MSFPDTFSEITKAAIANDDEATLRSAIKAARAQGYQPVLWDGHLYGPSLLLKKRVRKATGLCLPWRHSGATHRRLR